MAGRQEESYKRYIIPDNIVDGGRFMGFKKRFIAEGVLLGLLMGAVTLFIPFPSLTAHISAFIVFAAPCLFLGAVGINGDPVSRFISLSITWFKRRGILLYNSTAQFLEESPVDAAMETEGLRDRIVQILDDRKQKKLEENMKKSFVEGIDFKFAPDKDLEGLIAERKAEADLIPAVEVEEESSFDTEVLGAIDDGRHDGDDAALVFAEDEVVIDHFEAEEMLYLADKDPHCPDEPDPDKKPPEIKPRVDLNAPGEEDLF